MKESWTDLLSKHRQGVPLEPSLERDLKAEFEAERKKRLAESIERQKLQEEARKKKAAEIAEKKRNDRAIVEETKRVTEEAKKEAYTAWLRKKDAEAALKRHNVNNSTHLIEDCKADLILPPTIPKRPKSANVLLPVPLTTSINESGDVVEVIDPAVIHDPPQPIVHYHLHHHHHFGNAGSAEERRRLEISSERLAEERRMRSQGLSQLPPALRERLSMYSGSLAKASKR